MRCEPFKLPDRFEASMQLPKAQWLQLLKVISGKRIFT
jgi:hypothetical protein